ncbi:hypothetical protein LTR91_021349 [Friedmanniomyces endolithicus]|uniref:Cercosporin MFS transporter CTB4 n=1 Tax=Friedmanniomyces endolithicus TaxID=329885 RepID=A0AAN6H778_9PEZI|nr:hypothetical protein LTR94_004747 [Friedmanniomyces endolithicus]KAK0813909.1 hypothetical protein LTR59_001065 [Friedmanniomyces endolithicus]KAK0819628.1 hypothetical protein LTR38_000381 [Friedmanniomyces endolithicus]KAK0822105.1 hypothetical protein LTR75_000240 [Friedmanniomyces endolithicus]KAK0858334.1 hypothetical protein LTR03_000343 [Friedmanniomyces endolithicus]
MSLETSTNEASQPMDPSEPFDRTTPSGLSVTSTKGEEESPDAGEHVIEKHNDEPTRPLDADVEKQAIQDLPPSAPPPEKDPDLVEFDGPQDPGNPLNWPVRKRIAITLSMGMMTFVVTFETKGFVLGPICFGPASEVYGRRVPLFSGYIVFAIFQIPVAVAQNVETIMLCRFIGGFAASAPLAVVAGALADIWGPLDRAYAICVFAASAFSGPVAGPIIGGFVTESYLGWRWTQWLTLIMAALFGGIGLFIIEETSAARILQIRAKKLRFETKNWALHAKADEKQITVRTILTVYLIRPFVMLGQEPILACITAYMSVLYGILYLLFEAYPIEFHEIRGWSLGVSALPFCAFLVGIGGGTGLMAFSTATNFKRSFLKHGKAVPEERLPPMIICAIILPIALFWFAWTSEKHISWVPSVIATGFLGGSLLVTFWQGINYLIDCYGFYSNSAIAVNTFIRSIAGAVFPLFASQMYRGLGVPWATSILAFICVAFIPAPILFYKYGARIRARSRFNPTG